MTHRAEVREREQGHARLDPQPPDELGRRGRDLREGLGVRIDVDGAVGEEERLLREYEHVDAAHVPAPGFRADHLERRAHRVGIVHVNPDHYRVRLSGAARYSSTSITRPATPEPTAAHATAGATHSSTRGSNGLGMR